LLATNDEDVVAGVVLSTIGRKCSFSDVDTSFFCRKGLVAEIEV